MTSEAFIEVLKSRRSIRRFKNKSVPRDVIYKLIEAASWAPSAGNRQNWEFTVVTSMSLKEKMAEAVRFEWNRLLERPNMSSIADSIREYSKHFDWFARAPVLVVLSAKSPEGFMNKMFGSADIDVAGTKTSVAMAAENLMLAAHSTGIGSCCLTAPLAAHESIKTLLGLGARQVIVCLVALGYADEKPDRPPRKAQDSITRFME